MDVSMRLFLVGIFGIIIGMVGAFSIIEMIDRSERYISEKSEHPPDNFKENLEREEKEK